MPTECRLLRTEKMQLDSTETYVEKTAVFEPGPLLSLNVTPGWCSWHRCALIDFEDDDKYLGTHERSAF